MLSVQLISVSAACYQLYRVGQKKLHTELVAITL